VHIGHLAGVYVPADIYTRYLRLKGEPVLFVGGSDEHGVPITIRARREGITPQDVVDRYHKLIRDSFEEFGISFDIYSRTTSKTHAKMASDFKKPDRVHTLLSDEIEQKMWPLPVGELYGCGKQTSRRLCDMGIRTIGDVAASDRDFLSGILGQKAGEYLWHSAHGSGSDKVATHREEARSYSNETTTRADITFANYERDMPPVLEWLSASVAGRLRRAGVFASTIGISVKTNQFRRRSRQCSIPDSTNDKDVILATASHLMAELVLGENGLFAEGFGIRLVGVSASDLDKGEFRQMSLFDRVGGGADTE
jgi:DNA polymerase-4